MRKYALEKMIEFNKGSFLAFMVINDELDEIISKNTRDKSGLVILRNRLENHIDRVIATLSILNKELEENEA